MSRDSDLRKLLDMDGFDYKDAVKFLNETGIMDNKSQMKLFMLMLKIANSNGYKDAIQFAIEKERERFNKKEEDNNNAIQG